MRTEGRERGHGTSPVWQSYYHRDKGQNPYPLHKAARTQQNLQPSSPTPAPTFTLQAKASRFSVALGPLSFTSRLCSCFHLSGTLLFSTLVNPSSKIQPSTPCTRMSCLPHWAPEQPPTLAVLPGAEPWEPCGPFSGTTPNSASMSVEEGRAFSPCVGDGTPPFQTDFLLFVF